MLCVMPRTGTSPSPYTTRSFLNAEWRSSSPLLLLACVTLSLRCEVVRMAVLALETADEAEPLRIGFTVDASEGSEMTVGRRLEWVLPPSTEEVGERWRRWEEDEWCDFEERLWCEEEELCLVTEESALEP